MLILVPVKIPELDSYKYRGWGKCPTWECWREFSHSLWMGCGLPHFFLIGWWFGSIHQNLYLKFTMAKLLDLGIPYCKNLYCRNISMADKEYMKKMFTETFLYFLAIRDCWKQVTACPSWSILQIMKQEVACIYGRMSIMYYWRKMKLQKLVTTNKSQISIHMCMRKICMNTIEN